MKKTSPAKSKPKKSTPLRSRIRSALRMVWMRSPERAAALCRDNYTCQKCGAKQNKRKGFEVKVQEHHIKGIFDWKELLDYIEASGLFCDRKYLTTECVECHKKEKIKEG